MSKEDLLKPFPKELVKPAPAGKFGDYVPHANYVERLHCEPVYGRVDGVKRIVGAKGSITIEGMGTYQGFGDVDTFKINNAKFNDGTNLKDAESDAFKRACMRFGLGVELWSGSTQTEEEASAEAGREANVEVQKVDMRKKENKPTPEDTAAMNAIMDSIVGEGESEAPF